MTGAHVTNIHYTQNATNPDAVDAVIFTTDTHEPGPYRPWPR